MDGKIPVIGIVLCLFVVFLLSSLTFVRYNHELEIQKADYSSYLKKFERDKILGVVKDEKPITPEEFRPGYQWTALFNCMTFAGLSWAILLCAMLYSVSQEAHDLTMLIRRSTHSRIMQKCALCASARRAYYHTLNNQWESLRQSAQLECAMFFTGVYEELRNQKFDGTQCTSRDLIVKAISAHFNNLLSLPKDYEDIEKVALPEKEEEMGSWYATYMTECFWFDAYYKGAIDAVNTGKSNPDSMMNAIAYHSLKEMHYSNVTPILMMENYNSGFTDGSAVRFGAAWKRKNNPSPDILDVNTSASKDTTKAA